MNEIKVDKNVAALKLIEILKTNNSDYLQKARKYGHFTGYKN